MALRIDNTAINRVLLGFFAAFVVVCVLVAIYEAVWVQPEKQCLAKHHWWDRAQRVCATPVDLRVFTGRPNVAPPAIGPGSGRTP